MQVWDALSQNDAPLDKPGRVLDPEAHMLVEKCAHKAQYGYHAKSAQERASKLRGQYPADDRFTREELYRIPAEICDEIANAAARAQQNRLADNLANKQSDVETKAEATELRPNEEERLLISRSNKRDSK